MQSRVCSIVQEEQTGNHEEMVLQIYPTSQTTTATTTHAQRQVAQQHEPTIWTAKTNEKNNMNGWKTQMKMQSSKRFLLRLPRFLNDYIQLHLCIRITKAGLRRDSNREVHCFSTRSTTCKFSQEQTIVLVSVWLSLSLLLYSSSTEQLVIKPNSRRFIQKLTPAQNLKKWQLNQKMCLTSFQASLPSSIIIICEQTRSYGHRFITCLLTY